MATCNKHIPLAINMLHVCVHVIDRLLGDADVGDSCGLVSVHLGLMNFLKELQRLTCAGEQQVISLPAVSQDDLCGGVGDR